MSFVSKLFGIDTKAAKRAAEEQARALRESAAATAQQSREIAQQSARQQEAAAARARATELAATEVEAPQAETEVDIGAPEDTSVRRKRQAYQAPTSPSGSIRI